MLHTKTVVGAPSFLPYVPTIAGGTGGETSQGVIDGNAGGVDYRFVPFVANGINYCEMNGRCVISAHFTGCTMAAYTQNGVRKVCHVSTGEFGDCSGTWSTLKANSTDVIEFKPSDAIGDTAFERVYGLITPNNEMYTIITASSQATIPSGQGGYRTDAKIVKVAKGTPL